MEKAWFYQIIFMVKDKKRCPIKDTMSIKISFMHYRNYITRTRVKSAVAFEEFDLVYLLWLFFSFRYHCQSFSIYKRSTLAKIWMGAAALPSPSPRFLRAWYNIQNAKNLVMKIRIWNTQTASDSETQRFIESWSISVALVPFL